MLLICIYWIYSIPSLFFQIHLLSNADYLYTLEFQKEYTCSQCSNVIIPNISVVQIQKVTIPRVSITISTYPIPVNEVIFIEKGKGPFPILINVS